jgi:hypothetical protein
VLVEEGDVMNIVLWVLQILLAVAFAAHRVRAAALAG